jgi:hypothetical protein
MVSSPCPTLVIERAFLPWTILTPRSTSTPPSTSVRSRSKAGKRPSSPTIQVTSAPRRENAWAASAPEVPPPTTTSVLGMDLTFERKRGARMKWPSGPWASGPKKPEGKLGFEPLAMTARSKAIRLSSLPSRTSTISWLLAKCARPRSVRTPASSRRWACRSLVRLTKSSTSLPSAAISASLARPSFPVARIARSSAAWSHTLEGTRLAWVARPPAGMSLTKVTPAPQRAASTAASIPAGPPPITTTRWLMFPRSSARGSGVARARRPPPRAPPRAPSVPCRARRW